MNVTAPELLAFAYGLGAPEIVAILFVVVVMPVLLIWRTMRLVRKVAPTAASTLKAAQSLVTKPSQSSDTAMTQNESDTILQHRMQKMLKKDGGTTETVSGSSISSATHNPQARLPPTQRKDLLTRAEQQFLAFRHVFPPRLPMKSLTFFGGAPIADKNFVWPVVTHPDGRKEPIHFMGQVDCSTIPDGPNRNILPAYGILYFFAPSTGTGQRDLERRCVQYVPKSDGSLHEIVPPVDLGPAPSQSHHVWQVGLPSNKVPLPQTYRKVEMEMGWLNTILLPEHLGVLDNTRKNPEFESWAKLRNADLAAFFGEPSGLPHLGYYGSIGTEDTKGFPWNYHGILVFCGMAREWLKGSKPYSSEQTDLPDVATLIENQKFWHETGYWIDKALAAGLHSEVSSENATDFLRWVEGLPIELPHYKPASQHDSFSRGIGSGPIPIERQQQKAKQKAQQWMAEAIVESAEYGLQADKDFSLRLPSIVVQQLKSQHHPFQKHLWDSFDHSIHHMLGTGRDIQSFAMDIRQQKILLMQFDTDSGINWQTGDVGAYYYAIDPEDLANHRFDNVTCTFECH